MFAGVPVAEVAEYWNKRNDPTMVIDCWRTLDSARLGARVKYIAMDAPPRR